MFLTVSRDIAKTKNFDESRSYHLNKSFVEKGQGFVIFQVKYNGTVIAQQIVSLVVLLPHLKEYQDDYRIPMTTVAGLC
ncbi:hypothetical protein [Vibrio vulnificus]|uniref:Uncharacterized protein n=1 Tax=Vibrio vulnificus TaxID=672 RepID=A0A2S3QYQ6_VIBVL|nr:hypothetical protein [Vibrio vulnificus]ELL0595314.1 hypothetical protein [Vibrio vulnificus]ELP6757244.1 hypothetical protein [Vibrio vulnificus]MBN8087371.1 hypothetical protein [Vibrio vulnificus]MBN8115890.1 hypothetical protein [Vibrio vulnificus]MDK2618523.1 hypothetical protein [Vibrio vulnificus]